MKFVKYIYSYMYIVAYSYSMILYVNIRLCSKHVDIITNKLFAY